MRPRKTDRDLPPCVYRKHGAYWYVKQGKWRRLADELPAALAQYARLKSQPTDGMPGLLARWIEDAVDDIAPSTAKTYRVIVKQLTKILAEFQPDQVTARDITAIMHHHRHKPGMANHMRTVLICALDFAYLENLVERNVARDTRPLKIKARDRYLADAEFAAIRSQATPTLAAMMDMLFHTGQRISDIIKLRHADITEDGIYFKQKKTGNRLCVEWSPELRNAVAKARSLHQSVKGMTLFHTRQGGPFSYSTVRTWWDQAIAKSGIVDAHIHDIRAKAGTDARAAGQDSQTLLGHKTESSHQRYLRSKETPVARPAKFKNAS